MKKFFLIMLSFVFLQGFSLVLADEWSDFSGLDRAWDGQKSITNKEFEEAIDTLEAKQKKREEKQKNKLIKKISGGGTSLHSGLEPNSDIKPMDSVSKKDEGLLLNIPVSMLIDNQELDKGYYKVFAEKDKNGDVYFLFYQSQYFKGKVRASETTDDFGEETVDFVKLTPYDKNFVRIIFGSLEYNAYAYVRYRNEDYEN